jgi:hypothetical protein
MKPPRFPLEGEIVPDMISAGSDAIPQMKIGRPCWTIVRDWAALSLTIPSRLRATKAGFVPSRREDNKVEEMGQSQENSRTELGGPRLPERQSTCASQNRRDQRVGDLTAQKGEKHDSRLSDRNETM